MDTWDNNQERLHHLFQAFLPEVTYVRSWSGAGRWGQSDFSEIFSIWELQWFYFLLDQTQAAESCFGALVETWTSGALAEFILQSLGVVPCTSAWTTLSSSPPCSRHGHTGRERWDLVRWVNKTKGIVAPQTFLRCYKTAVCFTVRKGESGYWLIIRILMFAPIGSHWHSETWITFSSSTLPIHRSQAQLWLISSSLQMFITKGPPRISWVVLPKAYRHHDKPTLKAKSWVIYE